MLEWMQFLFLYWYKGRMNLRPKFMSMYTRISRNLEIKLVYQSNKGHLKKNLNQYKSFIHGRAEQSIWPSCTP